MKTPDDFMKRWLFFFVFLSWSLFLLFLLAGKGYTSFLRPRFGLFLAIACFITIGYMITAVFKYRISGIDMSVVSRTLVLLLPILYCLAARDSILGSQVFIQRFTGTFAPQSQYSAFSDKSRNNSGSFALGKKTDSSTVKSVKEETILDIYRNTDFYKGRNVSVKGMIIHDEGLKRYFGGRDIAVYRFVINCCAADALPLAVAIEYDHAEAFKTDQWVQVEGIFDLRKIDDKFYPVIAKPFVKPVEAPSFPYLF